MEANRYARIGIGAALIAGCLLCMGEDAGGKKGSEVSAGSQWLLFPAQDESSVELKIAKYLKEKEGTDAVMVNIADSGTDLVCMYAVDPTVGPRLIVVIDTHVARLDKETGKVTARCVEVSGHYELPDSVKTSAAQAKLLEYMNSWHQNHFAPGHICLGKDGNLELATYIVIPSPEVPVHAEMVRDSLYRTTVVWGEFYAQMAKTVDLPNADVGTSRGSDVPQLLKRAGELGSAAQWLSIKHHRVALPVERPTQ